MMSQAEPPAVLAHRLGRRYGALWALRDCSLRLEAGSVVAEKASHILANHAAGNRLEASLKSR